MNDIPEATAAIAPGQDTPAPRVELEDIEDVQTDPQPTKEELEKQREKAVRAEHYWPVNGKPQRLKVSGERWALWQILRTHLPAVVLDDRPMHVDAFAPQAWAMLWLCLHEPEEILLHAGDSRRAWLAIFKWAAEHCPHESWHEALEIMNTIRSDIASLLSTPRKKGRASTRLGE